MEEEENEARDEVATSLLESEDRKGDREGEETEEVEEEVFEVVVEEVDEPKATGKVVLVPPLHHLANMKEWRKKVATM